ncbi:MAG TPA: dihydrodipicolinate reductase C-terminal domain-containing protein [Gemmatimonadales bacterium]|nr:dihydrodipicolinate reductase C-terminal domain-containing protein [Gemmatimonadales bacterium]
MRLGLVGTGRMGAAVRAEAVARGHEVQVALSGGDNPGGRGITAEAFDGVSVALEFTSAASAPVNVENLLLLDIPVVTGTTGWNGDLPRLEALARERNGALLHAPNFSIGVQLLLRAASEVARWAAPLSGFDASILERHHRTKRDAPSGTALSLQRAARSGDPAREFPIDSLRRGFDPGRHAISWDAPYESLTLLHEVRDRAVFATGAVWAAEWLAGRHGVFTFEDVLFGEGV